MPSQGQGLLVLILWFTVPTEPETTDGRTGANQHFCDFVHQHSPLLTPLRLGT
jgi:hypothetical protein